MPCVADVIGSYRTTFQTGLHTGLAAGAALATFRWTNAVFAFRPRTIEIEHLITTGYTAAQELGFDCVIGRSWTVAASAGTTIVLTGNNNKKRVSYPASKFAAADVLAAGAVAITKGTVTEDANPILARDMLAPAGTAGSLLGPWRFDLMKQNKEEPIVLVTNEGLLVRNLVAQGAGGAGRTTITIEWEEVLVYQ